MEVELFCQLNGFLEVKKVVFLYFENENVLSFYDEGPPSFAIFNDKLKNKLFMWPMQVSNLRPSRY